MSKPTKSQVLVNIKNKSWIAGFVRSYLSSQLALLHDSFASINNEFRDARRFEDLPDSSTHTYLGFLDAIFPELGKMRLEEAKVMGVALFSFDVFVNSDYRGGKAVLVTESGEFKIGSYSSNWLNPSVVSFSDFSWKDFYKHRERIAEQLLVLAE